jgi:hypothetical protein
MARFHVTQKHTPKLRGVASFFAPCLSPASCSSTLVRKKAYFISSIDRVVEKEEVKISGLL